MCLAIPINLCPPFSLKFFCTDRLLDQLAIWVISFSFWVHYAFKLTYYSFQQFFFVLLVTIIPIYYSFVILIYSPPIGEQSSCLQLQIKQCILNYIVLID